MYGTDGGCLSQQSSTSRRFGKDIKRGEKKKQKTHKQNTEHLAGGIRPESEDKRQ